MESFSNLEITIDSVESTYDNWYKEMITFGKLKQA